jgi:uncharacterized protein YqjF (DUF2071 family)
MTAAVVPPAPRRPSVMRMRWVDLLFAHWPVPAEALRPRIPAGLDLDTFDGQAWLGIVPFVMEDVAPRWLPAVPRFSRFPELNVRTYVTHQGAPGIWFLSLDARSRVTVWGARTFYHLPYVHARMTSRHEGDWIVYESERDDPAAPPATFHATYRPTGPVEPAAPGSFEAWSTRRWRLFAADRDGRLAHTEIRHEPWPLQPASAEIDGRAMAAAHGLTLPDQGPHLCFSRRLDVRGWWPRPLDGGPPPPR